MEENEKLRNILSQLSGYREMARALQQQMAELTNLHSELSMTLNFVREMEKMKEGDQILVPIGSGSFVKARLDSVGRVLVGMGAGVVVEKSPNEAKEVLEKRMKEVDDILKNIRESLEKIEEKIRALTPEAEKLIQQGQRES